MSACTFGAAGHGSGGPGLGDSADGADDLGSDDSAGSEGEGDSGGGGDQGDGGGDQGDGADDTAGGDEASGIDDGGMGDPTKALLVLNDGMPVSFAMVGPMASQHIVLALVNDGEQMATNIQPAALADQSFKFIGGFPGAEGDCGNSLAPGEMCTIDLTFEPLSWGRKAADLAVTYEGGSLTNAHIDVDGMCGGTSDELITNGSFEGSLDGWGESPSSWTTSTSSPFTGQSVAFAGDHWSANFQLSQTVGVGGWASAIDGDGVQLLFAGHQRRGSGAQTFFRLRFLDSGGGELDKHQGSPNLASGWQDGSATFTIPSGTRSVQVTAICEKLFSDTCDGYFDGVSLITRFPAQ